VDLWIIFTIINFSQNLCRMLHTYSWLVLIIRWQRREWSVDLDYYYY